MDDITRGDPNFYVHSNAHIDLSNAQLLEPDNGGRILGVTESMIYSAARFTAFLIRRGSATREEMVTKSAGETWHFTEFFRECLEANMRENIERFDEK